MLRPVVFFVVPLRLELARDVLPDVREREVPERARDVPDVPERARDVPDVPVLAFDVPEVPVRDFVVPDVPVRAFDVPEPERDVPARDFVVPDVPARDFVVPELARAVPDRDFVVRDVPARDFVVPDVPARDFVVPDVPARDFVVPEVERDRDVPDDEREVAAFLAPLLAVVFFRVVEPVRLVDRAELRDVPDVDLAPVDRDVPGRERLLLPVPRDAAARARETPSSLMLSVPSCSSPGVSGEAICSPNASGRPRLSWSSK